MRIAVCVKQVPDTTDMRVDPDTGTLIREGVPAVVNPYDMYALEAAARIRDDDPDTVIVAVSMGPESAESALRECLAVAADKAYLVTGREFAGSDTAATAYILSLAVRTIERLEGAAFDAVFCGKQAIDGDTAQVGPELAERLCLPQVTYASGAGTERTDDTEQDAEIKRLIVLRDGQYGDERIAVSMPCLVTFTKPAYNPRAATLSRRLRAGKAVITRLAADDIDGLDTNAAGLKGSPTRVIRTEPAISRRQGLMIDEDGNGSSAARLAHILRSSELI